MFITVTVSLTYRHTNRKGGGGGQYKRTSNIIVVSQLPDRAIYSFQAIKERTTNSHWGKNRGGFYPATKEES